MVLVYVKNLKKYYGERLILTLEELEIHSGDKMGIVGVNGAGKTTLLEILSGRIAPDEGIVKHSGSFAYIPQLGRMDGVVLPEMAGRMKVSGVQPEYASGGEAMRLKIAQAFATKADLLFADEPTSNLDIDGINILRKMLKTWLGALVIVSHDQELLNECCTKIVEIENGRITTFSGNYSDYQKEKERQVSFKRFEYEAYCREKARIQEAVVNTAVRAAKVKKTPTRMGLSEARLHRREATEAVAKIARQTNSLKTRLEKLAVKEAPQTELQVKMVFADLKKPISKTIIQCSNLQIAYGKRILLEDAGFLIPTGSRNAIIGPNGCGKTSLLRRIKDFGAGVRVAPGVNWSWFEQDLSILREEESVLGNVMESTGKPEWMARTVLARLLFKGDNVYKPVSVLSGGERCKVCFAKILLSGANLIGLDEPTNYLDINSLEALGRLLAEWPGTLVFVSHDRAFVSRVATRLLIFEERRIKCFEGNYRDYASSQNRQDQNQEILVLKMKIAELTGKLGVATKAELKDRYKEEIEEITERVRGMEEPNNC